MNLQGLENKKWDFNKQEELTDRWYYLTFILELM